jgi:ribonuclease HI
VAVAGATAHAGLPAELQVKPADPPAAVYADGGVVLVNPSPHGGTWAYCWVDAAGARVFEASGVLLPETVAPGAEAVSNNDSEFFAVAKALASLPDRWSGPVYTDSRVTICRMRNILAGFPVNLSAAWTSHAARLLGRLGPISWVLLDGHPTKAQLAAGIGKRGNPCSAHNVWCDQECGRVAEFLRPRPCPLKEAREALADVREGAPDA